MADMPSASGDAPGTPTIQHSGVAPGADASAGKDGAVVAPEASVNALEDVAALKKALSERDAIIEKQTANNKKLADEKRKEDLAKQDAMKAQGEYKGLAEKLEQELLENREALKEADTVKARLTLLEAEVKAHEDLVRADEKALFSSLSETQRAAFMQGFPEYDTMPIRLKLEKLKWWAGLNGRAVGGGSLGAGSVAGEKDRARKAFDDAVKTGSLMDIAKAWRQKGS